MKKIDLTVYQKIEADKQAMVEQTKAVMYDKGFVAGMEAQRKTDKINRNLMTVVFVAVVSVLTLIILL